MLHKTHAFSLSAQIRLKQLNPLSTVHDLQGIRKLKKTDKTDAIFKYIFNIINEKFVILSIIWIYPINMVINECIYLF